MSDLIKCDICEVYEGKEKSLKMHKIHCKKRHEKQNEPEAPARTREVDRSKRVPFGAPQRRLHIPNEDPNFQYRIFNDSWAKEPGRITRALKAGYEIVENTEHTPVGTNEDGSAIKGVLMRIPKEIYKEDQKLKMKEVDRVDQAIQGGKLEEKADDKRYVPDGIKIHANFHETP